jgi:hypothetical protein
MAVASIRRQAGYSMVSIMVGLVISLLTVGAMLAIYRTVVEVSGRASADAVRDGQVASGLMAAQLELHNAGYRIDLPSLAAGDTADSAEIQNLAIAVKSDDKRVVTWRYLGLSGGAAQPVCARLSIAPQPDGSTQLLYRAPEACASVSSASWTAPAQVLVSYPRAWQDRTGTAVAEAASGTYLDMVGNAGDSGFRIINTAGQRCTLPYAQQDPAQAPTESPRIVLERGGQELFSACLANIVAFRHPAPTAPVTPGGGS